MPAQESHFTRAAPLLTSTGRSPVFSPSAALPIQASPPRAAQRAFP